MLIHTLHNAGRVSRIRNSLEFAEKQLASKTSPAAAVGLEPCCRRLAREADECAQGPCGERGTVF